MRKVLFIIALIILALPPVTLTAAGAADNPPRYEDSRLGEKKDESDKFKFVRIKAGPIYAGEHLGDGARHGRTTTLKRGCTSRRS